MSKKIIAIILCLVLSLSLVACGSETTYSYEGVAGGPQTATNVSNNGMGIVFVDGFAYYVNSSRSSYADNTFGEVEYGCINRMDLATGEIVTVQPKLVADQNGVGIYVYGDKIYYTSPGDTIDRDGKTQRSYLDIMVCNLDGSNTQKLYTFGYATSVSFVEENGVVFAVFQDATTREMKAIDLSKADPASHVIASDYVGGISSASGVYILKTEGTFQNMYKVSMNGEETLVVNGKTSETEKHNITILSVKNDKIYYSMNDSVVKQNTVVYSCDLDGSNQTRITSLSAGATILEYNGGYIFQVADDIFYSANGKVTLLDESKASSFRVEGDYLFTFTFDDKYRAELNKTDIKAVLAGGEVESTKVFEDTMYQSSFGPLAFNDGVGYYFSGNSENVEMFSFDVETGATTNISK